MTDITSSLLDIAGQDCVVAGDRRSDDDSHDEALVGEPCRPPAVVHATLQRPQVACVLRFATEPRSPPQRLACPRQSA